MTAFLLGLCAVKFCMGGDEPPVTYEAEMEEALEEFGKCKWYVYDTISCIERERYLLIKEITKTELKLKNDKERLKKLTVELSRQAHRSRAYLGNRNYRLYGRTFEWKSGPPKFP